MALFATTGVILGRTYMLYLYGRMIFGKLVKEDLKSILDLNPREIAIFAPLVIAVFWIGIYPSSFLTPMHASVAKLIGNYHVALAAAHQLASAAP